MKVRVNMCPFQTLISIIEVCRTCLGILQYIDDGEFIQNFLNNIASHEYSIDSYTLAVTVPTSIIIRHYRLWYYLQDRYPDYLILKVLPSSVDIPEVKEVFKWYFGHTVYHKVGMQFEYSSPFEARIVISHEETNLEFIPIFPEVNHSQFLENKDSDAFKPPSKKRQYRRNNKASPNSLNQVVARTKSLDKDKFKKFILKHNADLLCPAISNKALFTTSFFHQSIWIGGRYVKYRRDVPQSQWLIDGVRHGSLSVQEYIGPIVLPYTKGDNYIFSAAGREDIDVRMLGRGRPFLLEIVNPRIPKLTEELLQKIQNEVNEKADHVIWIVDLQMISDKERMILKQGETEKKKSYRAVVWIPKPITPKDLEILNSVVDLKLDQKTPVRVLHRRSLAVRPKMIHSIQYEFINSHYIIIDLVTQSGTYVKEFVHGDLGRTSPSFCALLGQEEADILRLDVSGVELDWPKRMEGREEPPAAPSILEGLDLSLDAPELERGFEMVEEE